MSTWAIVVVVVAALVVVALVAVVLAARRRRALRARFGAEYQRMVAESGSRRIADSTARDRLTERQKLDIRPLPPDAREKYANEWQQVQARFVDAPSAAVSEADSLVTRMMHDRGYPIDRFEHQAALISVDHPMVVENYRHGHRVYLASVNGSASTEDMRRGIVAYRSLFGELLDRADADASR
jgi:hypothetical protein